MEESEVRSPKSEVQEKREEQGFVPKFGFVRMPSQAVITELAKRYNEVQAEIEAQLAKRYNEVQAEIEAQLALERTPWGRLCTARNNFVYALREALALDKLEERLEPVGDWIEAHQMTIGCLCVSAVLLAAVIGCLVVLVHLAWADSDQLVISDTPEAEPYWAGPVEIGTAGEPPAPQEEEGQAMPEPGWMQWCAKQGVPESSIDAIDKAVHDLSLLVGDGATVAGFEHHARDFEPEALVAVLWTESRCQHWDGYAIRRGDSGRAIGIGQVHTDPWLLHLRGLWGEQFDLRRLDDNVAAAAFILFEQGGWVAGDEQAQLRALTFYNTGKRSNLPNGYARQVHKLYREIRAGSVGVPARSSSGERPVTNALQEEASR